MTEIFWISLVYFFLPRFYSVQFSCSVVSDTLRPHEPQHARPPCPSPTPGVHPNPCPLHSDKQCLIVISFEYIKEDNIDHQTHKMIQNMSTILLSTWHKIK